MEVVHCEKLLDELTGQVKEIGEHFASLRDSSSGGGKSDVDGGVTDDDVCLQRFCMTLEKILRHGIKDRLTFFGGQRDYWKYLSLALETTRSFAAQVKTVQDLEDVQSSQGKGRALVRIMLAEHSLADAVQHAVSDSKLTSEWYQGEALLRNEKHSSRLIDQLYELSAVDFLLPNTGQSLDSAWPTFARRTFGGASNVPISINPGRGSESGAAVELGRATHGELAMDESSASDDVAAMMMWAGEGMQAMDRSCWSALHFVLHHMTAKKMSEDFDVDIPDNSSQRLKELTALVLLARENWGKEHGDAMKHVQVRCDELRAELESKATAEIALRGELAAMRQTGVTFGQGQSIAEIDVLQTKLKQAEKARDSAKQVARSMEQECDEAKKECVTLQHDVVVAAESLAAVKEQLNFVEVEYVHFKEDMDSNQRASDGRATTLQTQLQNAGDFLDTITKGSTSQPPSPSKTPGSPMRLDLLGRLQLLNSAMQDESLRRARAQEKERETAESLAEVKAHLDHELSTINFRLSAETMQLQNALEQSDAKDRELAMLKERMSSASRDSEQTRSEISSLRIENARLTAENQTQGDKTNRLSASLLNSQKELMTLEEQLLAATHERDSERIMCVRLTNKLEEIQDKCSKAEDKMREHLDELVALRRQLLLATQQKAELVNKTANLEDEVIIRSVETWVNDEEADACMLCAVEFSLFTRRHHCRHCGRVFCYDCCCKTFQLPSSDQPSRVCNECHGVLQSRRQGVLKSHVYSLMTESQASASLSKSLRPYLTSSAPEMPVYVPPKPEPEAAAPVAPAIARVPVKAASVASLNDSKSHLDYGNTASEDDEIVVLDGGDALEESAEVRARRSLVDLRTNSRSGVSKQPTHNPAAAATTTAATPSSMGRSSSARELSRRDVAPARESAKRSESPIAKTGSRFLPPMTSTPKTQRKRSSQSSPAPPASGVTSSPATSSRSRSTPTTTATATATSLQQLVPDTSVGPTIRSEFTSLTLQPGAMAGDALLVDKPGMRLVWQFRSEPKGVAFGVLYQMNSQDDAEAIVAFKRYLSHRQTIQGSIVVPKRGLYTLQFSNMSSSNVPCRLWYRHDIRGAT